jgi:hypothetical protein
MPVNVGKSDNGSVPAPTHPRTKRILHREGDGRKEVLALQPGRLKPDLIIRFRKLPLPSRIAPSRTSTWPRRGNVTSFQPASELPSNSARHSSPHAQLTPAIPNKKVRRPAIAMPPLCDDQAAGTPKLTHVRGKTAKGPAGTQAQRPVSARRRSRTSRGRSCRPSNDAHSPASSRRVSRP